MEIYPATTEQQNYGIYIFGASLTSIAGWSVAPGLGFGIACVWGFVSLWVTTLRPMFVEDDLTEEEKLTRASAQFFKSKGRERWWWRRTKAQERRLNDSINTLKMEVDRLKREAEIRARPLPEIMLPNPDKALMRSQDPLED